MTGSAQVFDVSIGPQVYFLMETEHKMYGSVSVFHCHIYKGNIRESLFPFPEDIALQKGILLLKGRFSPRD